MAKRARLITKRVNMFDGKRVTEEDLDVEQIHNNAIVSNLALDFHGSGIVNDSPFEDVILLDTRNPGLYSSDGENASKLELESGTYDGLGITLDKQPSDAVRGNRLEFEVVNVDIKGRRKTKIMVLGRAFDGLSSQGGLVLEFIDFPENSKKISQHYYLSVVSIFFNNFSGGVGKTENLSSEESLNLISKNNGYLIVREAPSLSIYPATKMSYQIESPNIDLINFITSNETRSITDEIELALGSDNVIEDIYIDLDGREKLRFEKNSSTAISYGQKFLAKTNNIQKVDLLLSVERDESLDTDNQFDFSGDIVVSIHELISEVACASDAVPDDLIDFDPEITPLVEVSFSQEDLELLGYKLTDDPQVVSFNFAGTLIADPNIDPSVQPDKYYALLISRQGDNRTGTVIVEKGNDKVTKKTNDGTPLTIVEQFGKQQSKFVEYDPVSKRYINDSQSSLWYVVHSDALEISDGTAYTDYGVAVTVPKTESFVGNTEISKFERNISLRTVSEGSDNYLIMSQKEEFSESDTHPRTGNRVFTRIADVPDFSVVNETELDSLLEDSIPLILAKINDSNVRDAQNITGVLDLPGLIGPDYIILVNPNNDILNANLVNRIITPDTNCDCNARYRIARVDCENIKIGDLNSDGELNSEDLSLLLNIVGSTINSATTEREILGGEKDIVDFIKSDLNDDGTVDGTDIEILEDAVDGYINFSVEEEIKVLYLRLENILKSNDKPTIFTDTTSSGTTTASSATLVFTTSTDNQALMIRPGDAITIPADEDDTGTYIVNTKTIGSDNVTVTLTLLNEDGTIPNFAGSTGFNVAVVSGTDVNTYADNVSLMDIPFSSTNYEIEFIEAPFQESFIEICDLHRNVGTSFIELENNSCKPDEEVCLPEAACSPVYKNQTYIPGDLYLPNGNILTAPGVPHSGDFEYTSITLPLPAGSITDCSLNLYSNFVKSSNGTSLTVSGYPAMKYSDGSLVGCEDDGLDTDIIKGRVKFDHKVSSIFVDSLVDDGYIDGYSVASTSDTADSVEVIAENYTEFKYQSFDDWTENSLNDTILTNISHVAGIDEPAIFDLTTSSDSGTRFGRLDSPSEAQNIVGDFIIDFSATRTTWNEEDLTNGVVSTFATLVVTNDDDSTSILKLGWKVVGGYTTKLFYSGVIQDSTDVIVSTFSFEIDAPDDVGDEVAFRLRRVNDVISAYYIIPTKIVESTSNSFGHYVKIGTNPEVQPGFGTATMSFEIAQQNSPITSLSYFVRLSEVVIKSDYISDPTATTITIGKDELIDAVNSIIFTVPININRRTVVTSAILNLVSATTGNIVDDFIITPINLLNADNLGHIANVPLKTGASFIKTFSPGTIIAGDTISIDITNQYAELSSEVGHLPGFLKGFIITPDDGTNSSFDITSDISINVDYEDSSTGIVFKVGIKIDPTTGIVTFNTRNILYDTLVEASRTVLTFGVYLKKSGFKNSDVNLTIDDLSRLGVGTCFEEQIIEEDGQCFYIVAGTGGGTFIEGPIPCV